MPRVKVSYRTSSREVYNRFCAAHPSVSLSFDKWLEIIYTFNQNFRDHLLETGDRSKLPWGLGTFSISKKKTRRSIIKDGKELIIMAVDWAKTKKAGKKIYHLNTHTDNYRYKWKWFNSDARFYQADIWVFKPSRVTSRKLAEYLKRPNSPYPQLYREWDRKK
jgi:hypothetical protein